MKNLKQYPVIVAISLASLIGCRPEPIVERNVQKANGYDVMIHYNNKKHEGPVEFRIGHLQGERLSEGFDQVIYAMDEDGDGRFDRLNLYAPKGSPLEELASIKKLDEIYAGLKDKQ
jgi:hypothetical protein